MLESQYIEWKLMWKDDYLKWLCAFANTTGGLLYIGINDNGKIIGAKNATELVETIPKKARDLLGIIVEAKIKQKKKLNYVCIKVEEHNTPVSYRGKYYLRSGSNTYEAKGLELNRLLLRKSGVSWESSKAPKSNTFIINDKAINAFKKQAFSTRRLPVEALKTSDETLLRNLKLYNEDELTKAAILLFSTDPETLISGSYIKIALFAPNNIDIIKEDEIHGSIILQIDKTLDILYNKYFELIMKYNKKNVNLYAPREAMKEIIINAIEHKAYDTRVPILIGVYKNKITIWNPAENASTLNIASIYNPHASIAPNPLIANVFYRCGLTTAWGLGIERMKNICIANGIPLPKYRIENSGIFVRCNPNKEQLLKIKAELSKEQIMKETLLEQIRLSDKVSAQELQKLLLRK